MKKPDHKKQKVRLYPTHNAFIDGVPAVITDCWPEKAAQLLAYQPPAFTTTPPAGAAPPDGPEPDPEDQ